MYKKGGVVMENKEEKQLGDGRRGRLRVFFGFAAGVGKHTECWQKLMNCS